jgi:hypothetical protein
MTNPNDQPTRRLARRDYLLLPAVCLLTVLAMFVGGEAVSRLVWSEGQTGPECHGWDPQLGIINLPNCSVTVKGPETSWITYHYNECGFRSTEACGSKPAGTRRVAVLGSSFAEGANVPYDKSFSALSAARLTRLCHAPVEFQNLGVSELPLPRVKERIGMALRLQPDAAILAIAPFDLEKLNRLNANGDEGIQRVAMTQSVSGPHADLLTRVKAVVRNSRAVTVVEHFMFENPDLQVKMYLQYGDKANFLRPPFSPEWQQRLAVADTQIGEVAARFRAAGVPMFLLMIPQRTQAELLVVKARPPGVDPMALQDALRAIAQKHGVGFIDLFSEFRRSPHPGDLYFPVDNHLNEDGSQAVARSIVASLSTGGVAAFDGCAH